VKIYVSGPISGRENGNVDAFRRVQRVLERRGHVVVVPHDVAAPPHEGPCPPSYARGVGPEHTSAACFLRGDLRALLDCEAAYMLVGWERSVGARLEFDVAALCGLAIFYEPSSARDVAL
jgi:hypothetical protein